MYSPWTHTMQRLYNSCTFPPWTYPMQTISIPDCILPGPAPCRDCIIPECFLPGPPPHAETVSIPEYILPGPIPHRDRFHLPIPKVHVAAVRSLNQFAHCSSNCGFLFLYCFKIKPIKNKIKLNCKSWYDISILI